MKKQYALSFLVVLLLSLIVNYFFSYSKEYLIPLAALCMLWTLPGSQIFQSLLRYLLLLLLVAIFSWLFSSLTMLYARIADVSIGTLIGVIVNVFLFPKKADAAFRAAIIPILTAYENYFSTLMDTFIGKESGYLAAEQIEVELKLRKFPLWIYARGFDFGLQTGYRYFLGKVQLVGEILFAMHHTLTKPDRKILKKIKAPLLESVSRLQYLFKAMITVFQLNQITEGVEDCLSELYELESKLQSLMPIQLEMLDLPNDYLMTYEFVYCLKDLRLALIKLAQALR